MTFIGNTATDLCSLKKIELKFQRQSKEIVGHLIRIYWSRKKIWLSYAVVTGAPSLTLKACVAQRFPTETFVVLDPVDDYGPAKNVRQDKDVRLLQAGPGLHGGRDEKEEHNHTSGCGRHYERSLQRNALNAARAKNSSGAAECWPAPWSHDAARAERTRSPRDWLQKKVAPVCSAVRFDQCGLR